MKRLWFQLATTYTLLAVCAFGLLIMIMYGFNDYKDFDEILNPHNIEQQIVYDTLLFAEILRLPERTALQDKVLSDTRLKLVNLEESQKKGEIYRITNSSNPEIFTRVIEADGNMLVSDPENFPADIASVFAAQEPLSQTQATWLNEEGGPIWVDMPVESKEGEYLGRVQLLYVAKFDWWVQIGSVFRFLILALNWVIICSVPIGIACGIVAARYVTKQLQKMNEVTESWRQGHFEARIELPNDDVLTRHSQHLNDMAQDLEMYLNLKENLAVSDERNRVARELHDTVKQKLFALGLQLATAKAKPAVMDAAGEHVLEAETITREAQHDLMEIITQLRPAGTNGTSLYDRISMIAEDSKRRFGVEVEINYSDSIQFNATTEHHVLRIVQESLMNAVRHGKANHIVVTGKIYGKTASLTIADDGEGFDAKQKTGGFGITSMRDRVRDLPNGKFEISSAAGSGTTITLSWKNES